jgi:hypothetical protein
MSAKWIQAERPQHGDWLGGALMCEQGRVRCLQEADGAERRGEFGLAKQLRDNADVYRRDRDRIQREEERRAMNRSLRFGRRRY